MARSVRIEYAGAVYHIMCRGDRKENIFHCNADRVLFLETLAECCKRTGFRVHAYVLMPNHYHLLLETPEPNLVDGMKWFQGTYTQRFNCRHHIIGHLFQGRYKAFPVETENPQYFRRVSEYIHLNPARAHLCGEGFQNLQTYVWSSFPIFIGKDPLPFWLVRNRVFQCSGLHDEGSKSRKRYAAMIKTRLRESLKEECNEDQKKAWEDVRSGWYLGSEDFGNSLRKRANESVRGNRRNSYRPEGLEAHDECAAVQRLEQGCKTLGISLPELWRRRQTDPIKQALAWWVKSNSVVSDEWLCSKLEMGCRTNIHRAVAAYRRAEDSHRKDIKRKLQLCAD